MIKHIKCDIFESGADVILHQVNCQGAMNSGVAKQVREKYPIVFQAYKALCSTKTNSTELLGTAQVCRIGADKYVVNLFAQNRFGDDGKCFSNFEAVEKCLQTVRSKYDNNNVIAIPYLMACHRGGGDWNVVYKMIEDVFGDSDCDILICEYNGG